MWSHGNAVGNGASQQMIQRRIRVGTHTLCGEVAVASIAYQQALALQVTGNAVSNGVRYLYDISTNITASTQEV
jgi:hypothetical protein